MPRTADHIVAVHQVAEARRAAGKKSWVERITLHPAPAGQTFETSRDELVAALKRSSWFKNGEEGDEIHDLIDEIKDAEGMDHFTLVLDAIYDEADFARVWIGH